MAGRYSSIPSKKVKPFSVSAINIQNYISSPEHIHQLQNVAYLTFLGLILCLSWNLTAVAALWIQGGEPTRSFLLAISYLIIGVPAAYASWYRTLNLAFQEENPAMLKRFIIFYLLHIAICVFASFYPLADRSLTSIFTAIAMDVSSGHRLIGMLYFIGFWLFILEYALSLWVLVGVWTYQRSCGSGDDGLTFIEP